jgi:hypothetical protein
MSITPWLPTVRKIKDGEPVDQATVNVPLDQLTQREQHLYEKFEDVGNKSVLISFGQPLHPLESLKPNELCLVYYKKDTDGEGLSRSITGFNSGRSSSMFSPKDSNYVFGLIKHVYTENNTADIYTEGLCDLGVDLDDPVLGLIKNEPFTVGPYYLSSKLPGKITKDPAGIPVYIGYAINKRQFLLHTNVDEFSQFFINYRYHLLDRVAGEPVLANNVWSINVREYADAPVYVENSGSSANIVVTNTSTAYVGTPSKNIDSDLYTITVTTAGNISTARFSISSASLSFLIKNNQPLNSGVLSVETTAGNNVLLDFSGSTAFVQGSAWTLKVSSYPRKLGWIPAELSGGIAPEGALFYYNIPGVEDITYDTGLDYDVVDDTVINYEKDEALELDRYLPPIPANFIQLYTDGMLARYKDTTDTGGTYSVNDYGIWWHSAQDGEQPWSSDYPQGSAGSPNKWRTEIKDDISGSRKRIFVSFSRFNPALRTQLVSSLKPFDTSENRAVNFIKFYGTQNLNETSKTGDLVVDIEAPVNAVGYKSSVSSPSDAISTSDDFIYPGEIGATGVLRSVTYTADRAIAAIKYVKSEGAFKAALTPVVSKLEGLGAITIRPKSNQPGVFTIGYLQEGFVGQVDSIEPINARLEFRGLSSYIKLPPASTTPYGLIGKIILPKGYISNKPLKLIFHLFGDLGVSLEAIARKVAFNMQYSAVSAINTDTPSIYNTVDLATFSPAINPVEFSLDPTLAAYTAYTSRKIVGEFIIPADFIREDAVINFKILRVATAVAVESYEGNIGLLGVYWEILN